MAYNKIKIYVSSYHNRVVISRYRPSKAERPRIAVTVSKVYYPSRSSMARVFRAVHKLNKPVEMTVYL